MVAAKQSARKPPPSLEGEREVSATVAKNEFGRVLDMALRGSRVVITKHNAPTAVLLSADAYEALAGRPTPDLDALRAEFDVMLKQMQTPTARAAASALFAASPSELGDAAVAAAHGPRRAARRA
ncbi:MAG: type II toxin-antitoxin system Phd/YefM family antitoxin [Polyangiaceae bacterium]